jgi:hypothetical protein
MKIISAGSLSHGGFEGASDGPASISMILDESGPAGGPRLHRHPPMTRPGDPGGNLLFQVGEKLGEAGPGDIVLAPPRVPRKFTNQGSRTLASDLHSRQPDDHRRVPRIRRASNPAPSQPALTTPTRTEGTPCPKIQRQNRRAIPTSPAR